MLFNQKQKEEKPQNAKKKTAKPTLKATKADQKEMVGEDDDGFDEDAEVPVEFAPPKYNKDDDFMWV